MGNFSASLRRFLAVLQTLYLLLEGIDALSADTLAAEIDNVLGVIAENASRLVLLQDYSVVVREYLHGVLLLDIKYLSDFDGQDYSAKLINSSDDSR